MKKITFILLALFALGAGKISPAQRPGGLGGGGNPVGPLQVREAPSAPGIAWFGTWNEALAEAKRTGRPILFMSAAPQCRNVPGVW